MSEENRYVVGFAFAQHVDRVLLVNKLRPEWQKGLLNGIGGKIEDGESPMGAMHRECKEEAGTTFPWEYWGVMKGENNDGSEFECHVYYAYTDRIREFKQTEDERLEILMVSELQSRKTVANLQYLIPFGLTKEHKKPFMRLEY